MNSSVIPGSAEGASRETINTTVAMLARPYNTGHSVAMDSGPGTLRRPGMTGDSMQPFDLVIRGGALATASDSFMADLGIRDGKIAAIGEGLDRGKKEIDARGR